VRGEWHWLEAEFPLIHFARVGLHDLRFEMRLFRENTKMGRAKINSSVSLIEE
jgi:hypothetical protein